MLSVFSYLFIGISAGFLAGLLGIGGGVIIVPALAMLFVHLHMPSHSIMHMAASTSLATVMFTTGLSVIAQQRRGAISWNLFRQLAPGVIVGTLAGTLLASLLPSFILRILFGLFVILIAIHMWYSQHKKAVTEKPVHRFLPWAGSLLMGFMAGMLGIGGGILAVPLLLRLGLPIVNAIATSSACALLLSIIATLSFTLTGQHLADLPPGSTGFIYWPAVFLIAAASLLFVPLGTKVAHRLPDLLLKRIFAVMLLLVGVKMLAG